MSDEFFGGFTQGLAQEASGIPDIIQKNRDRQEQKELGEARVKLLGAQTAALTAETDFNKTTFGLRKAALEGNLDEVTARTKLLIEQAQSIPAERARKETKDLTDFLLGLENVEISKNANEIREKLGILSDATTRRGQEVTKGIALVQEKGRDRRQSAAFQNELQRITVQSKANESLASFKSNLEEIRAKDDFKRQIQLLLTDASIKDSAAESASVRDLQQAISAFSILQGPQEIKAIRADILKAFVNFKIGQGQPVEAKELQQTFDVIDGSLRSLEISALDVVGAAVSDPKNRLPSAARNFEDIVKGLSQGEAFDPEKVLETLRNQAVPPGSGVLDLSQRVKAEREKLQGEKPPVELGAESLLNSGLSGKGRFEGKDEDLAQLIASKQGVEASRLANRHSRGFWAVHANEAVRLPDAEDLSSKSARTRAGIPLSVRDQERDKTHTIERLADKDLSDALDRAVEEGFITPDEAQIQGLRNPAVMLKLVDAIHTGLLKL